MYEEQRKSSAEENQANEVKLLEDQPVLFGHVGAVGLLYVFSFLLIEEQSSQQGDRNNRKLCENVSYKLKVKHFKTAPTMMAKIP